MLSEYFKYLFARLRMRFDSVAAEAGDYSNFRRSSIRPIALNRAALSHSFAVFARSLLFNALFYINIIARMIVALPTLVAAA